MAGVLKSFIFLAVILVLIWVVFITLVIILKSKISQRVKSIHDFQDKYRDLDEAIRRKKEEIEKSAKPRNT